MVSEQQAYEQLKAKLSNREFRLNNLYYIKDKAGRKVLLRLNWAQRKLYDNLWYFNLILKARQLGFTTFIMIYFLDACLFNRNHAAGVIAHTKDDAEDLFTNKVKFAYDNLPDWLRSEIKASADSAKKLVFSNGSSFTVGTSLRSGTYQKLLVSEFGKVSAKYPEKAKEIKTGALNTVDVGQQIFVESTAEGKAGEFFDLCESARKLQDVGRELTRAEPKFHFFSWFDNPDYTLPEHEVALTPIDTKLEEYLAPFNLTAGQRAWYASKAAIMGADMKREFPSTPAEAFEGSMEGGFYTVELAALRKAGRIRPLQRDPSHAVLTFWDLGLNDQMSIWFAQLIHGELYFIDYHESSNEGWEYYAKILQDKGYVYRRHYFPHDGNKRVRGAQVFTDRQLAEQLGIRPISVIPVTTSVFADIKNYCKPALPLCTFNDMLCGVGIMHLGNYRKKWDKVGGMFTETPLHDEASHGADAFRTAAVAFKKGMLNESEGRAVASARKVLVSSSNIKREKIRLGRTS
jgi:hypothetical protein